MPKVGMEPVRRAETINATLECICKHGIDHITLDMVATKAGFSKGIVAYYFKSKKNLILESLQAFLSAYKLKIGTSINKNMSPLDMVRTIIDVTLPPLSGKNQESINVFSFEGVSSIRLPQEKIAKLFIQFIALAAIDHELKQIMRETYVQDVEGISMLIGLVTKGSPASDLHDKRSAYALFAMIYGLSFFRINDFMPAEATDNREIAFEFIQSLIGKH